MLAKSHVGEQVPQTDQSRMMLDLLETIEREGEQSQRAMADKFGVALGLVNACIKTCVKKGYVKIRRLPPRRYAYMLTPKGAAEKLRLTLFLLSRELRSFKRARTDYRQACQFARSRGWQRTVLVGASELAEICALCALETDLQISAVVDAHLGVERFVGAPLIASLDQVPEPFDGAMITDTNGAEAAYIRTASFLGSDRVIVPAFFGFAAGAGNAV